MGLREDFMDQMKASMKAGDAARTSTLRMILAKLKDTDIASRPKGVDKIRQGNRPELAAKEEAEIAVIEAFLPAQMDDAATKAAVDAAVAETGAASVKDMGKVMAALKARHGATLDMSKVGGLVKAALA